MISYLVCFWLFAWVALNSKSQPPVDTLFPSGIWKRVFWILVIFMGLRYRVGCDWLAYDRHLENMVGVPFSQAWSLKNEPIYSFLVWVGAQWGDVRLVNTVCAIIFVLGLIAFCRQQPRPWLALAVAAPYLIVVVGMGYTRQGAAIGFEMLGLASLQQGRIARFLLLIAFATGFHKTAVVVVPLAGMISTRYRLVSLFSVGAFGLILYQATLESRLEFLIHGYMKSGYSSSGAAIRVAMNALPATLFLVFRRRFELSASERGFWTLMSLTALAFVVWLAVSPSSTAVDRVALYLIPLQLFVWSRLPDAFGFFGGSKSLWKAVVVIYSAVVQLLWMFMSDHARCWDPYRFYPWVAFWE